MTCQGQVKAFASNYCCSWYVVRPSIMFFFDGQTVEGDGKQYTAQKYWWTSMPTFDWPSTGSFICAWRNQHLMGTVNALSHMQVFSSIKVTFQYQTVHFYVFHINISDQLGTIIKSFIAWPLSERRKYDVVKHVRNKIPKKISGIVKENMDGWNKGWKNNGWVGTYVVIFLALQWILGKSTRSCGGNGHRYWQVTQSLFILFKNEVNMQKDTAKNDLS